MELTQEHVASLAPDASALSAGKKTSDARHWKELGRSDEALWGECQGSALYQVRVSLSDLATKCTCPSRKFPCKHALGLLFLAAQSIDRLALQTAPDWVTEWMAKRGDAAQKKQERSEKAAATLPADPEDVEKRAQKRMARVLAGIDGLERWLCDLARTGLASVPIGDAAWSAQAARLVDAQAPGLAFRVRQLGEMPRTQNWAERMVDGIGRLMLLLQAARKLDALDLDLATEVRTAVGWTFEKAEVFSHGHFIDDSWAIVGQTTDIEGSVAVQRTWLRGIECGRDAMVLQFAAGQARFTDTLLPGTVINAALALWPGALPLRALVKERRGEMAPLRQRIRFGTVGDFLQAQAEALGRNPWLNLFPAGFCEVVPICDGDRFLLVDKTGAALSLLGARHWKLMALSGGHPIDVFGEWDGWALRPLSAFVNGQHHDLDTALVDLQEAA